MKKKCLIFVVVALLLVGFASVATTLVINGSFIVGENKNDFKIIFTNASLNSNEEQAFISEDKKSIHFVTSELKNVNDTATLEYEVSNTSRNYDADVQISCHYKESEINLSGLLDLEFVPSDMVVLAGESKSGMVKVTMTSLSTEDVDVELVCELVANALERDVLADEFVQKIDNMIMYQETNISVWQYSNNIKTVTIEDVINDSHKLENSLIFDISDKQNGTVMAYLNVRDDSTEDKIYYDLYIQANGKIYTNYDSSGLFSYFTYLENINGIENLDTSKSITMASMFFNCMRLKKLDLSNFDTSNVVNMNGMFYCCQSLEELDLSSFDTSKVTDMSYMFNMFAVYTDGSFLKSINLSSFDTSSVTDMSGMFSYCGKLETLSLGNFDTSNVTDMNAMFSNCTSLTELNLRNFNTDSVTNFSNMFLNCSKLNYLDYSNFNTENATSLSGMFSGCQNLKSIDITHFNTYSVQDFSSIFSGCSGINDLDLSKIDTRNTTNMSSMFAGCSGLTTIDLSKFSTSKVTNFSNMFRGCTNLTSIDLTLLDTSNAVNMSYFIAESPKLTTVDFSTFNTSKVRNMEGMFKGCSGFNTIDLSYFDTSNVTNMNYLFKDCININNLDFSTFVTENLIGTFSMFENCRSLTRLDLSSFTNEGGNLEYLNSLFYQCTSLSFLDISGLDLTTLKKPWISLTNDSMNGSFVGMPLSAKVYVKNLASKDAILALRSAKDLYYYSRPDWTASNVIVKA